MSHASVDDIQQPICLHAGQDLPSGTKCVCTECDEDELLSVPYSGPCYLIVSGTRLLGVVLDGSGALLNGGPARCYSCGGQVRVRWEKTKQLPHRRDRRGRTIPPRERNAGGRLAAKSAAPAACGSGTAV